MTPFSRLLTILIFSAGAVIIITFGIVYKIDQLEIHKRNIQEKEFAMTKLPKEIKKKLAKPLPPTVSLKIPILVYHYIEVVTDKKDTMRKSLAILPTTLDKQIQTLKNAGYTFITTADIGDALDGKKDLPQKVVVLTFDDGYRDFYTDAFPILEKEQVKAVAYIVPGFLDRLNYLYAWQLHEISQTRLVEIGAHTVHHVYLKGTQQTLAANEITGSKHMLEKMLHRRIVSFAYPYGAFDDQAIHLVKNAGSTTAVSTIGGNEVNEYKRFFLYRIHPGNATGKSLLATIERTYPNL